MMVLQQSESKSSLGSQMLRMDSAQQLSHASSFSNLNENEGRQQRLMPAGSSTDFMAVHERDSEHDESMIQRVDDDDDDEDDESVMQRADDDDMTSQSES